MKKVFVAIVAVAMTLAPVAPAAAQTVSNTGNGVDSNNTATVNQNNSTSVSQSNTASINNSISVISNTGDNTANRNTGGDVSVSTGDAGTKVAIENNANQNVASLNNCCATAGGVSVGNAGNGDSSDNTAAVNTNNTTALTQANVADVTNLVTVDSNTGGNEADRNTGGDVSVSTGDSLVGPITVKNNLNSNSALIGPGNGAAGAGAGVTVGNVGNGVESDNVAVVNMNNTTALTQFNNADVLNWVGVTSNTGYNTANRNTGGEVEIDTGDSAIAVGLSTNANSNAAWVNNCGCVELGGTTVLNKGNGDSSDSDAVVNKNNTAAAFQANASDIANVGYFLSDTGYNEANRNTGAVFGYSDPSIDTGVAYTNVGASTNANQNFLNSGVVAMPTLPPMTGTGNGWWSWAQWGYGYNMSN